MRYGRDTNGSARNSEIRRVVSMAVGRSVAPMTRFLYNILEGRVVGGRFLRERSADPTHRSNFQEV